MAFLRIKAPYNTLSLWSDIQITVFILGDGKRREVLVRISVRCCAEELLLVSLEILDYVG